ncbi:adenylosuccinate synthetase [Chitinophaga skermanii]|uniref:Adenylosuccinate synthetase n=1 Tax=Chitinophaga skermanii TaxID=331697 RepID=A0A327Q976_9BACT|nr:adenylosuccinate synthase [Chitinophaga skermanii]RAJ00434.1 adenylosuccinate synthetase [Chitinophaga skermanii]
MKADIVLGLQWGDEGKGKIVDILSPQYKAVARFHGGANAGHTLIFDGQKVVLNTIPSGIFRKDVQNVIGTGVVFDAMAFQKEVNTLEGLGYELRTWKNLSISYKAHLLLPTHKLLDQFAEESLGENKIGSTQKGIAPAYADKILRKGLRVGEILSTSFEKECRLLMEAHASYMQQAYNQTIDIQPLFEAYINSIELVRQFPIVDTEKQLNELLAAGEPILAEGAQATLLDIDHGTYPYVTSSNTTAGGVCTGLGIAPRKIGEVYGVFKAYCTRVGNGPFATELHNELGEALRAKGQEFGAVTKRARRVGWLDIPALKYAVMLNGVTQLIMTKADVLSQLDTIQICTHYTNNQHFINKETPTPAYITMEGWQEDITAIRDAAAMPPALVKYIQFLENELQVPITYVSVGPDRAQMIQR